MLFISLLFTQINLFFADKSKDMSNMKLRERKFDKHHVRE